MLESVKNSVERQTDRQTDTVVDFQKILVYSGFLFRSEWRPIFSRFCSLIVSWPNNPLPPTITISSLLLAVLDISCFRL